MTPRQDLGQTIAATLRGQPLGRVLRVLRVAAGLSQGALAEALGIPQGRISEIETGSRVLDDAKFLAKYLRAVGHDPQDAQVLGIWRATLDRPPPGAVVRRLMAEAGPDFPFAPAGAATERTQDDAESFLRERAAPLARVLRTDAHLLAYLDARVRDEMTKDVGKST